MVDPSRITNTFSPNDKAEELKNNLSDDEVKDISLDRMRWANRRRIAWVFSYAAIVFAFLILTVIVVGHKDLSDRVIQGTDLLTWLFMGMMTIPSLYFGGTVLEKFSGGKNSNNLDYNPNYYNRGSYPQYSQGNSLGRRPMPGNDLPPNFTPG